MSLQAVQRARALAETPLRETGPRAGLFRGTLRSVREIFAHRELLSLLTRRELKARYKDSVLGFFWSLARPLAMLLVYYVAIGKFLGAEQVAGRPGGIPEYAIFIFSGLTAWQLFSEIVTLGTGAIVANSGLIKKIYVPREVYPLSVVGSALVNFAFQLVILVAATALLGSFPTGVRWLYFPLAFLVLITFATALALVLSAVNVYLRDIQYLIEIIIMVLFWASPIVYAWSQVEPKFSGALQTLYLSNPMTLVALGFQRTFWVAGDPSLYPAHLGRSLGVAFLVSLVLLWLAQRLFARLQGNFAQEL
jgi:ABC-2 type transport system permease protein